MATNIASTQGITSERLTPLEAVLSRLRGCSGFPTLSATIGDINRLVSSDSCSTQQLTQVILRDASLTTKLLQLVNSAVYGQFRGHIRTVSKAVLILGFEAVCNAAMTLMMLEFSNGRPQEKSLRDDLLGALFAGVLSKALCARLGISGEEAVICTICQNLGRLLVTFFLYEQSREIQSLVVEGVPEEQAAQRVLGIAYRDLGVGVAQHWSFPQRLVEGMKSLSGRDIQLPGTDVEKLRVAANLANDLYVTALRTSQEDKTAALQALSHRYRAAIKLNHTELVEVIQEGLEELAEHSTTLNLAAMHSPAVNVIRAWTGGAAESAEAGQTRSAPTDDPLKQNIEALDALESGDGIGGNAQQALSSGIRDVTEALTSDFALNDVLQMVVETIHRGIGGSRTMIFVRDVRLNSMRARFGFGAEIERIIPQCSFPVAFAADVFHVALEKGVDIVIENAQADNTVQRIPQWHRQVLGAKSFLLLPVMLKNRAIGLLYADSDRSEGIKVDAERLGLLRTLRSQVVLAFKHCGGSGTAASA